MTNNSQRCPTCYAPDTQRHTQWCQWNTEEAENVFTPADRLDISMWEKELENDKDGDLFAALTALITVMDEAEYE